MKNWLVEYLICPSCLNETGFELQTARIVDSDILSGQLVCKDCKSNFAISNGIPRIVRNDNHTADHFGHQWQLFRTIQIDRLSGHQLSRSRVLNDTRWGSEWIKGKLILDAGCGAGRFADELAQMGAHVIACDFSKAVDACRQNIEDPLKHSSNRGLIEIIQADLNLLPLKFGIFDAVHCAGVIQHTANPQIVMRKLPKYLKSNGKLFYNFYEVSKSSRFQLIKNFLRRFTPGWKRQTLLRFSFWLCLIFFIPSWLMHRLPLIRFFNRFLPICSTHPNGLSLGKQFNLTLLDTVDWYGPEHEIRQEHKKVARLLVEEEMEYVSSEPGLAWATKP